MLLLLIVLLFSLLLLSYVLNKYELLAPSSLFTASIFFGVVWAYMYRDEWSLNLHDNTFWVIIGGVFTFIIVALFTNELFSFEKESKNTVRSFEPIETWKLLIIVLIELFTIVYSIHEVRIISPAGSLPESISLYRAQSLSNSGNFDTSLPRVLNLLRTFTDAAGYFFGFVIVKRWAQKKKLDFFSLLIVFFSAVNSVLLGARSALLTLMICLAVYVYAFLKKKNSWSTKGNLKLVFIASLLFILVVFSFQSLASMMGRDTSEYSFGYYLAIYFGAEIKNLDIFLQGTFPVQDGIFGGQTFIFLHKALAPYIGVNSQYYTLDLPFLSVNGLSLGNVYTTFYPFVYDFGYAGVPFLVGIMAIISQISFKTFKHFSNRGVSISVLIYSKIVAALVLSFFSNKFYENIFNSGFIKTIVIWMILDWLLFLNKKFRVQREKNV
ncbi:polysaccharide polymerase [Levilactobacillus hammesii DSM 16381]|uniref:Polysaccharide polymerase n=2 Tax=Levilactobacillus hammesii TaxID=267633 RepID=A0A0R1ULM3_9LACO|nr:O-antigen polymerase [Levilactobacillus hammesii]KRL94208.1 polysaccharide polymerase [Levilactobacillus hammesii DSM 16381]